LWGDDDEGDCDELDGVAEMLARVKRRDAKRRRRMPVHGRSLKSVILPLIGAKTIAEEE